MRAAVEGQHLEGNPDADSRSVNLHAAIGATIKHTGTRSDDYYTTMNGISTLSRHSAILAGGRRKSLSGVSPEPEPEPEPESELTVRQGQIQVPDPNRALWHGFRSGTVSAAAEGGGGDDDIKGLTWALKRMNFSFHVYANARTATLRRQFGIDERQYTASLGGHKNAHFDGGKSGAIFFFSKDQRYIVKEVTKAERRALLKLLPEYRLS
eukprot:COSAG05_NODE_36_length_27735_cov_238.370893_12_plen_210_part_00